MGIVSPSDSLGIANNIALPAKYINYKLVISKPSYATYQQTFTKTQLKQYYISSNKGPLIVVLSSLSNTLLNGLVAYYPLNGDVLDHSGNNNNGTAYGRSLQLQTIMATLLQPITLMASIVTLRCRMLLHSILHQLLPCLHGTSGFIWQWQ